MKEVIDVNVSYDTTFEDNELLRLEMEKLVRHPDNARDFQSDLAISVFSVGDLDKLQLKIAMKHKSNWHNEAVRATRRAKVMCALARALKRVPMYAPGGGGEPLGGPTNPAYSVAVSDDIAAAARSRAAKDKEGKRLVKSIPLRGASTASKLGSKEAERRAAQELNTHNPALEAADGWALNVDDNTLNSRDQSLDRNRSNDLEAVRQELITKKESQRGRRQAGQGLPALPLGQDGPAVRVSSHPSPVQARSPGTFDIESQTGRPVGFGQTPSGDMTTTVAGAAAQSQPTGYSVFPPQRGYSPPSSSGNAFAGIPGASSAATPHPLQSAPVGSRQRGASVSQPQQQQRPF